MITLEVVLKLLLAVALGGLIGVERETSQKPAGFRTNILICLSSTMMMILSSLVLQGSEGAGGDQMRMAAAVITGIGFIGAGTIIQARGSVVGITTAATLWTVAGIGLLIGAGYYFIAIITAFIIILTLVIFRQFEEQHMHKSGFRYTLKSKYSRDTLFNVKKLALHEGIRLKEIVQKKEGKFSIMTFTFPASEEKEQEFHQSLSDLDEIVEIKID
jgi:putative Mg2+ transporter-C (MgtC) family protein